MAKIIDWAPIEVAVRLGKLDNRAIADKFSVSYSQLRAKIKRHGWTPDLSDVVRAATRAELAKQAEQAKQHDQSETVQRTVKDNVTYIGQAINASVAENVHIITRHRRMANALMDLVAGLGNEVRLLNASLDEEVKMAISLNDRVSAVRQLAQTVGTVVTIERQAHNLDDPQADPNASREFIVTYRAPNAIDAE